MTFRASKSKPKLTENNSTEITLKVLSEASTDDCHTSDIEKLQNEILYKEKSLNIIIKHTLITLDANIDDIKLLIDQQRPEQKLYKLSICDLWLRLKSLELMEPFSLVTFLRTSQLHRPEINLSEINNYSTETEQSYLTNRRRSRLTHFHICAGSDEFNFNINSYVGLLIFSFDDQSKFILNKHHCQRGDIIIKETKFFNHAQTLQRGIYDALFKWYFNRSIDEKFLGVGFICSNGKWRFDLIAYDNRELLRYEYRIFDMFMLTHWLTQFIVASDVEEMEINAKDLLLKQYGMVKTKLMNHTNTELLNNWNEFIGSDVNDLQVAIQQFLLITEKDIEILFNETNIRQNIFSQLLTQNIS